LRAKKRIRKITANANNDITGVAVQSNDGGVAQVYSNGRVEIITDTGASGALWTFNRNGSLTFPNGTIQTTAFTGYATDNAARTTANSAYTQANTANTVAVSSYAQANAATIIAQAGFDKANVANTLAQTAFNKANTSNTLAQAAFDKANTGGSGTSSGYFPNSVIFANTTGYLSNVSSFQFYSSNNTLRTTSLTLTNGGAGQITFADGTTQTTAASGTGIDQTARTTANTANTLAQGAFDKANSEIIGTAAFSKANVANTLAQTAFDKANTANTLAQSAFDKANTALANTILLTGNVSPNLYTTSIGATVNSISVGGAPVQNAQVWSTYTMVQVFDAILFPTIGPSYTIPTITLTANNTGTLEIGQTINQSLSVTGTKNDAGAFTQLRITRNGTVINANNNPTSTPVANIASQFGYNDPNNQNYSYANTYIDSNTIVSGTTTWQGLGNYSAGLAKLNNKGATDSNAFAVLLTTNPQSANASTFASSSSTVTCIYPYFWGVSSTQPTTASIASAIQAGAGTTYRVLAVGSGTLTITFNASSQYIWLAVQTGYAAKTTWYNTALNNGSIGAGQFILSPVSQAVTSPNAYWSGVTYNVYISGYATTTSGSIQFS
jgi:hypothetical protein